MKKAGQTHATSWLMLLQIMAAASILSPSETIEWEKELSALIYPPLTTDWIEQATSGYLAEPVSWDPHAKSSTCIFDIQHFSQPQEPHSLSIPHHGLLSTGDAYPRAENPLDAGFASLHHGDGNSRAFGDHDHDPLRGENGDQVSSSSIHRSDSPLPTKKPQVGKGGQVKSSSQRKRKSRSDIPGSSAQPGMTGDSQFTEVPQNTNIHSSTQRKRKFRSKIQQRSAEPGMTDQSQLTEVAQHPEGAVETRHELHGNKSDSDQERAPAAPGPPNTTKAEVKREKELARARGKNVKTKNEVKQILDFTDRTLNLKKYGTFSRQIMGRIVARADMWLKSGEKGPKPTFTTKSVRKNVENITKISTYFNLKYISMLKTDKAEIIAPDEKDIEKVLLFMDIFWQKIYSGTLELPGKFTWIPRLLVRMDPNQFRTSSKYRKGNYFWLATSKEIHTIWINSHGNLSL